MLQTLAVALSLAATSPAPAVLPAPMISGDYLEIRSCDVFTGPCFANAEVNEAGKEATLAWKVRAGEVDGVDLAGRSVVAVVKASRTLGDPYKSPLPTQIALLFDDSASTAQVASLKRFVLGQLGAMSGTVVKEATLPIELELGCCDKKGCGKLAVGDLVSAETRCLCDTDHVCGNESVFYPPLTTGVTAIPAYTLDNKVACADSFGSEWSLPNGRGAFIGVFAAAAPSALASGDDDTGAATPAHKDKSDATTTAYALSETPKDEAKVPESVKDGFAKLLSDRALRLTKDGKPLYDLWLVKDLPLADKPETGAGIKFGQIPLGAFVGVLRSKGGDVDYRKAELKEGVYLLRYCVQPNNGNHLGTADTRDFVILSGTDDDVDPAPIGDVDKMVEKSLIVSPTDHCLILYMREPTGDAPAKPTLVKHPDRDEWLADVTVDARGKDAKAAAQKVRLGIVLVGVSPHP